MVQQKHNSYKKKKNETLALYIPQFLFFPILHSDALFVDFIFIQVQRNLLSPYKYGAPEVEMKWVLLRPLPFIPDWVQSGSCIT